MIYFNRTNVSKGTHIITTSASEEFIICHYQYFLDFKIQASVWSGCNDVLMMSMNLSDIDILDICDID